MIERAQLRGIFIEAGCALGGTSILIASLKNPDRPLFVYDVFGMIPAPTEHDPPDVHKRYETIISGSSVGLGGNKYYGYEPNLYNLVKRNFVNFGVDPERRSVFLIKGAVQDTLKVEKPVAFAHIDVDWYDPVKICLERIFPNLVSGGCIVIDDYLDWGGCKKATDEYLTTVQGQFVLDNSAGSLKIEKL